MRVLRCGEHAALVELDDLAAVLARYAVLQAADLPGVAELVPAARTVLVRFDPTATSFDALAADLAKLDPTPEPVDGAGAPAAEPVEITVRYDGEDLAEVAELAGIDESEVVSRHAGATYTCAFCGFAPGFGYLTGLRPSLHVPRRDEPRISVPAGAVAVADEFTAVYPRASPGGWRIIGHTDAQIWDTERDPPTLLPPGTPVRFVPAT